MESDISGNDGIRTSKELLHYKIRENLRNIEKNNFFKTLKINQRLAKIQRVFIEKKNLNLGKNSRLCDV